MDYDGTATALVTLTLAVLLVLLIRRFFRSLRTPRQTLPLRPIQQVAVVVFSAVLWASSVLGLGVVLALSIFGGETTEQLVLMGIAATVAGLGASFMALVLAGYQIASRFPREELRIELRRISTFSMGGAAFASVEVTAVNVGGNVPTVWEVFINFMNAGGARPAQTSTDWIPDGAGWRFETRELPLFPSWPRSLEAFVVPTDGALRELVVLYRFATASQWDTRMYTATLRL